MFQNKCHQDITWEEKEKQVLLDKVKYLRSSCKLVYTVQTEIRVLEA